MISVALGRNEQIRTGSGARMTGRSGELQGVSL